eukprot:4004225-Prymnesium_polylepis.2
MLLLQAASLLPAAATPYGSQAQASRDAASREMARLAVVHSRGDAAALTRALDNLSPSDSLNLAMAAPESFRNASDDDGGELPPPRGAWCDGEPATAAGRAYSNLYSWLEERGAEGLQNVCLRQSADRGITLVAARPVRSPYLFALPTDLFLDSARALARGVGWLAAARVRRGLDGVLNGTTGAPSARYSPQGWEFNNWVLATLLLEAEADRAQPALVNARVPSEYLEVFLAHAYPHQELPIWWLLFPAAYPRTLAFVRESTELLHDLVDETSEAASAARTIRQVHAALLAVLLTGENSKPRLSGTHVAALCNPWLVAKAILFVRSR